MRQLIAVSLGLLVCAGLTQATEVERLRLVPFPKEIRLQPGQFQLAQPLVLEVSLAEAGFLADLLNTELTRAGLPAARARTAAVPAASSGGVPPPEEISRATPPHPGGAEAGATNPAASLPAFRLAAQAGPLLVPLLPPTNAPEAYALAVRPDEIVCGAQEPAGLLCGLQTLCQLLRANRQGDTLPCLAIQDWPSLRWRCFQEDLTRGPSLTLDTLKADAALGAGLKLNLMTYYMEYQFAFHKHPAIGPTNGSLTPAELSALVAYAKPLGLDILGNQQSFGHFGQILKHPEFAALRETPDVLTPVREATYQLLDDLYSEVCPLLPFPWFNVCCDETEGLGGGPARDLAAKIGVGGVYVRHIRRVHDLLRDQYQKRMMIWGDIILQHPDRLPEIPQDTILLSWGYDARPSFDDQILPFARSGYDFFVCPGVNNWSRILPDFGVAVTNIQHFVRDGVKHGALGLLNTDWKDDGEAINAVKWHADAWAAECAWNASRTPLPAFNRRVGAVLFGEPGHHFGQAVELLAQTHRLPLMGGMFNARFWEQDFSPQHSPAAIQSAASNLLAIVRPALHHLAACRLDCRSNPRVLEAFLFGARRMELIGQRMLDGLRAAQLYEQACAAPPGLDQLDQVELLARKNRGAHAALGREFAALWLSENRPYALDWTLTRYTNTVNQYDVLLRKLAASRSAALAGQPLPPSEELGLAIPKPLSRQVRPRALLSTPLAAGQPWADADAPQRVGLVISAGAADRFDLPVEFELALPEDLAQKPVRAFVLAANGTQREVLAQLDPLSTAGHKYGGVCGEAFLVRTRRERRAYPSRPVGIRSEQRSPRQKGPPPTSSYLRPAVLTERRKSRLILVLPGPLPKGAETSVLVYLGLTHQPQPLPSAAGATPAPNGRQWLENDRVRLLLGAEGAHVYIWEVKSAGHRDLTMPGETGWAGFSDIASHRNSPYRLECTARGPALVEFQCDDASAHAKTIRLYGGATWMEVLLSEPTPLYWDFDNPKNFAADGPTPGAWLFSNGQSGPVGREADGVPAQVKAANCFWGIKFNAARFALGLATPGTAAFHHIAPGAGAGGVGIESSPPARHFVTFAGLLESPPAETMNRLHTTLDLKLPVEVRVHSLQARP